jgi:enoyl-CoA hydratase/carnithine racemase
MLEGLYQAARDVEANRDLRVLLIRSAGAYFSSGADLGEMSVAASDESPSRFRRVYREGALSFQRVADVFEAMEKPVVVAHQGPCLGGALELSLSCDFRLASARATYALPEIYLGLLPGSGGTSRLCRLVGPHWTRWLVLAGEHVDAMQALQIGFIHQVWPEEDLAARAWDFCRRIAALPPEAVAAAKLAIELSADLDRGQARNVERMANSYLFLGDEHKQARAGWKFSSTTPVAK